jgi:hypothetical protein
MLARFYLEVAAESRPDVGDKLYGYDDIEAEAVARGYGPREVSFEEMQEMEPIFADEWEAVQAEQTTVNDLLTDAMFAGLPVLFKTDGTNLGSPSEAAEIPHFGHSGECDPGCPERDGDESVYRLFPSADLVLAGHTDPRDLQGRWRLRDDVELKITSASRGSEGTTPAERVV